MVRTASTAGWGTDVTSATDSACATAESVALVIVVLVLPPMEDFFGFRRPIKSKDG